MAAATISTNISFRYTSATLDRLEEWDAVPGYPHGAQEVDSDLVFDVSPRLPLKLAADANTSVVDQCV